MVLHKTDGRRTTDELEEKESEKNCQIICHCKLTFIFDNHFLDVIFIFTFMICQVPIYENDVESEARITLVIMVIF